MKKVTSVLTIAVIGILMFSSCERRAVNKVAMEYLTAMDKKEFNTATQYVTDESTMYLAGIAMMSQESAFTDEGANAKDAEKNCPSKFDIVKTVIKGDTAFVTYVKTDCNGESIPESILMLVKTTKENYNSDENGYMDQKTVKERKKKEKPQKKWYVVINKEDLPEDLNNDAFMDFEFDEDFDAGFNGDEDDEIVDEEPVTIEYEN